MATAVWAEGNVIESASMASLPQPRHSAPPTMQQHVSQDAVQEEVVWDDSMMDLDDYEETQLRQEQTDAVPASGREEDIKSIDIDPSLVRTEALHLRGVDNLSTDDVRLYLSTLYPSVESKIEWIDDTSLNVVYESADIATAALQTLSLNFDEGLEDTTLRPAKSLVGEKSIEGLQIRIAVMGDKKERGARDRSRWYLFNPHPAEEFERRRNDRRRGERRFDPYRRRRRSRSRSPTLNYDDPPRNDEVELFPSKVSDRSRRDHKGEEDSRSRSPEQRRRIQGSHPTFTNIVQTVSSSDQPRRQHRTDEPEDLFPSKIVVVGRAAMDSATSTVPRRSLSTKVTSLEGRISPAQQMVVEDASNTIELFPNKISKTVGERMEQRSLAERIQEDNETGARELFPELLRRGGAGRRRRRAEDHF